MRQIENKKITANFSLYEIIEGSLPLEAVKLNWQNIDQYKAYAYSWLVLVKKLQLIRDMINNEKFVPNTEIGLRVTSGFRCLEWELLRGRSGTSQHRFGAVDIQPTNCDNETAVQIIEWLHKKFWPGNRWFGGFAIKKPGIDERGNVNVIGFAHFDIRGYVARWTYK